MPAPCSLDDVLREQDELESGRLRAVTRDLISLLALPAMWTGQSATAIVETLIDVLVGMLRLDLAYVRLKRPGERMFEAACALATPEVARRAPELGAVLEPWLSANGSTTPITIESPFDGKELRMLVAPLGLEGTGSFAIGSRRSLFPTETESVLFKIAINQAAIGLQGAQLFLELERVEHMAIEAANLGTWDFRPLTGALRWSRRCKELVGLPPDAEVDYETFLSALHPEDRWRVQETVRYALSPESGGRYHIEYRTIGIQDGIERWLRVEGRAFFDDAGRAFRFLGVGLDITDLKRGEAEREVLLESERAARAEAERAGRLKDEFVSTLSHELRTPLNAILGWAVILGKGELDEAARKRGADVIERNARAQARLIDDLLDLGAIASGKFRLNVEPVQLAELLTNAVAAVRPSAEAKGVRLETTLDAPCGEVHGDAQRLQQVVLNLLTNAIKFTPRDGLVQVALRRAASSIEIVVMDTGIGIGADFLPHAFERFRQSDASTRRRHGGLGLGLAIVKHIVDLHGGSVSAESEGEGRGATFTVSLPAAEARRQESAAPQVAEAEATKLRGLKVLVVDDEQDAREILQRLLREYDAEVVAVGSAAEALQEIERTHPDVLLCDIGMPVRDGYQLIHDVRQLDADHGGRTPAAAVTAFARPEDRLRALQAGYQTHVAKPIEPSALVSAVASLATRRGGKENLARLS